MKRFFKHLVSLSAMAALALTAAPAMAHHGKKGKGFKKQGHNTKFVQASNSPHGSHGQKAYGKKGHKAFGKKGHVANSHMGHKAYGKKGHFDGRRQRYVRTIPHQRRRARVSHRTRRAGYAWIPGTWRFCEHHGRYIWADGYWARRQHNRRWVQGQWRATVHGWHFESGYWM